MPSAIAATALVAGCATLPSVPVTASHGARHEPAASRVTTTSTSTTTTEPPVAPLAWSPCNEGLQCATLTVPLDYADPDGSTVPISVVRHAAEEPAARIGSLVIDPGGPGLSGVDDMANELSALTPQVLDDFDVVMFDPPRGGSQRPRHLWRNSGESPSQPSRSGARHTDPAGGTDGAAEAVWPRV